MSTGIYKNRLIAEYSDNILPAAAALSDDAFALNKASGSFGSSVSYSDAISFESGDESKSVWAVNNDKVTPLVFDLGNALEKTIPKSGKYLFSIRLFYATNATPGTLKINILVDGVITSNMTCEFKIGDELLPANSWLNFGQSFSFEAGDVVDFQFVNTAPDSTFTVYLAAMKLEIDNKNLGFPTVYSPPI